MNAYYQDKLGSLRDLFGTGDVALDGDTLRVAGRAYRIVEDVILLLPEEKLPVRLRSKAAPSATPPSGFSREIQDTFSAEWTAFPDISPAHEAMFHEYFDLVDLKGLRGLRACDLGCGIGRWSHFLEPHCQELVLVDFSEAIFVARRNLSHSRKALFFMGDITDLPFRDDAADFAFSLGVLHHLPLPALDAVRLVSRISPVFLVYLYYALDNRPPHYRFLLRRVDAVRRRLSQIKSPRARAFISWMGALFVYRPLVGLGWAMRPFGLSDWVPLHRGYRGKPLRVIRQDVYDRFFTSIEQRVSRKQILDLHAHFAAVQVADTHPYWHFLVRR